MTEKTPGQIAYEASLTFEGEPLEMSDGTSRWSLRTALSRSMWEVVAEAIRDEFLKELCSPSSWELSGDQHTGNWSHLYFPNVTVQNPTVTVKNP